MPKKMNPVCHFEMPAKDRKRMAQFYTEVFGWKTTLLGPEMNDYVLAATAETEDDGCLKNPGAINGGFYPAKPDWPAQYPSVVIAVSDIQQAMKDIEKNGGKILGTPMEIPHVGSYVSFEDTEGNRVSILQPINAPCEHQRT